MANVPRSARAICPYFLRSNQIGNGLVSIVCEGVIVGTETTITFKCRAAMEKHMAKRCETYQYADCPMANMINKKYGKDDAGE